MKILFAVSEAFPFVMSGGLGEVAGALPEALSSIDKENDIRVILPLYSKIAQEYKDKMRFIGDMEVRLSWRSQYSGIFYYEHKNVKYYFIDNEYYFNREGLYGEYDDGERFAFFCKAVLKALDAMDFEPDIIHCNDWHTALIPVYIKLEDREKYGSIKTLFTIHNIQYQGIFDMSIMQDVFDIPWERSGLVEFNRSINLMKGGIVCSDFVGTVSTSYAREIQTPHHACGLEHILIENKDKLKGILNGIDTEDHDPERDPVITANYSSKALDGKKECKKSLQETYGLDITEEVPVVAMVSRLAGHKGFELVISAMDELMKRKVEFIVLGTGERWIEESLRTLDERYPGRAAADIRFSGEAAKRIYSGADIFLMPSKSEPCGLAQMAALRYGAVPVVRDTGGLSDSIKDGYQGNGFKFKDYDPWEMLKALDRAVEAYKDKDLWEELVIRGMEWDLSWEASAREYFELYERICGKNKEGQK